VDIRYGLWVDAAKLLDPPIEISDVASQRRLFEGALKDDGVLYVTQLDEQSRLPIAQLAIRPHGSYVQAIWFERLSDGRFVKALQYEFWERGSAADDDLFMPLHGESRDGNLFVARAHSYSYDVSRVDGAGNPFATEVMARFFSTGGQTSLVHQVRGDLVQQRGRIERVFKDRLVPEGPLGYDWRVDPAVDPSGDGFWERVPEFGDWERFLVRDRPGVKVVY